jgi:hypothetical protein
MFVELSGEIAIERTNWQQIYALLAVAKCVSLGLLLCRRRVRDIPKFITISLETPEKWGRNFGYFLWSSAILFSQFFKYLSSRNFWGNFLWFSHYSAMLAILSQNSSMLTLLQSRFCCKLSKCLLQFFGVFHHFSTTYKGNTKEKT